MFESIWKPKVEKKIRCRIPNRKGDEEKLLTIEEIEEQFPHSVYINDTDKNNIEAVSPREMNKENVEQITILPQIQGG